MVFWRRLCSCKQVSNTICTCLKVSSVFSAIDKTKDVHSLFAIMASKHSWTWQSMNVRKMKMWDQKQKDRVIPSPLHPHPFKCGLKSMCIFHSRKKCNLCILDVTEGVFCCESDSLWERDWVMHDWKPQGHRGGEMKTHERNLSLSDVITHKHIRWEKEQSEIHMYRNPSKNHENEKYNRTWDLNQSKSCQQLLSKRNVRQRA